MAASEAAPYAQTGGLADVLEALPKALAAQGHDVYVVLPRYGQIPLDRARRIWDHMPVWVGGRGFHASIWETEDVPPVLLVDCPELFDRDGLYGAGGRDHPDNHIRFAAFSQAALGVARNVVRPRILHCHDWQTALAITYLRHHCNGDPALLGVRTLFTIHNLGYQGRYGREAFGDLGLDPTLFQADALEFEGDVNLLKGGIRFADRLSAVSPTYAREIQTPEHGFGLDDLLRSRRHLLSGILNGVDYSRWNPETDPYIAAHYSEEDPEGKRACKLDLLRQMGLPEDNLDRPLLGIVSRLADQKGFGLMLDLTPMLLEGDFCLAVLGKGESVYEHYFRSLAAARPDRIAVRVDFDLRLAHRIEAGADMFLMPSRYEPCGLNQIYSLRYGTLPIVRATGGLEDTVDGTCGFKFRDFHSHQLWGAIVEALATFRNGSAWRAMMGAAMRKDYSWDVSAARYAELYRSLLE